jgi:para-aminobenzoate synthetase component 1
MWSDRLSDKRRQRLAGRLLSILPAPRPGSRGSKTPLRIAGAKGPPSPEQLAGELFDQPGFSWLDDGRHDGRTRKDSSHRLYVRPLATLAVRDGQASVQGPDGRATFAASGFDLLDAAFAAWSAAGAAATLVGYLGYELGGEIESLPAPPPDDLGLPDLHLALYDAAYRWDGHGWTLDATDAWREPSVFDAEATLAAARRRRKTEIPPPQDSSRVISRPNRGGFEAAVARSVERIATGEIFQMNLCRRLEADLPAADLWPFYRRLRAASPAEHGAYLALPEDQAVLSISPELFLAVRDGEVESRPIKGTRPRGATPREDRALVRELLESEKDRAELTMIVDVVRNDLGRVCATGSVEVASHAELMSLPTLHHTVSAVRGRLRPDAGPLELLRATFPPASITGAPKIQAMGCIAAEEERRRGPAMGALGWISLGGDLELAVAIRTAVAARGKIAYHAGCGIVADSDPELEFAESAAKARAFLAALGARETG